MTAQIRHDIPGTQLAWSAYAQYQHYEKNFFLTEVYRKPRPAVASPASTSSTRTSSG